MTKCKECFMCWSKDVNSFFRIPKTDLNKCLLHLMSIKPYIYVEPSAVTGNQLIDFYNNCVWLCPRCTNQCQKILSAHNKIEMNTNLLKTITETYTSNILFDRNQNRPNVTASSTIENIRVDIDADATCIKDEVNHILSGNIKQEDTSETSDFKLLSNLVPNQLDRHSTKNVPLIGSECCLAGDNTLTVPLLEVATTHKVNFTTNFIVSYGAAPFICKNCRINYNSYQKLIDHVCAAVSECLVCDKVFNTQQKLEEHKKQFNKCFLCDHCPARFHFEKSLLRHQIRNHEDFKLKPLNVRENHQTEKNPEQLFSRPESKIPSRYENNPFHFKSSSEPLSEMASSKLPIGVPSTISQTSTTCGALPRSNLNFATTTKTSELKTMCVTRSKRRWKSYECTSCSMSFSKLKRLKIHRFEVHGFDNEFATKVKCTICAKYVKYSDDHMKKHLGILDYCCRVCNKKFHRAIDMEQHQKSCCCIVKM